MEAASPTPPPAPLPALPEDELCLGTGKTEPCSPQRYVGVQLVPQCPVLSASLFQPRLHPEVSVEAANFNSSTFFFCFFHDHDFVNKFIHPSHLALGFIHMQPGSTNRSLSAVLAARPDAPNELFAGKLQTCNYTQKLFSK